MSRECFPSCDSTSAAYPCNTAEKGGREEGGGEGGERRGREGEEEGVEER